MDSGHGRFIEPPGDVVAKAMVGERIPGVFRLGMEVECNGSRFKVVSIKAKKITLKLLPRAASTPE